MNTNNVNLINKNVCTGCSACYSSCPVNAISMLPNEEGFLYPVIDTEKCKNCGICYKICPTEKIIDKSNKPVAVYAGQCKDKDLLMKSSSGGIFAAVASHILENDGIVFGCYQDEKFNIRHMSIKSKDELYKLQGSKYVQSEIGKTYTEAKEYLIKGKLVLYSGTPCQIDGLKHYLGKKYDNLVTIDLVCHGITNNKLFKEYIYFYQFKNNIKILDYKFRHKDKKSSRYQGMLTFIENNQIKRKKLLNNTDIYSYLYMNGYNHRISCGKCKYASIYRNSDLTIGDYWGIESAHPELDISNGYSVILANTKYGDDLIKKSDISIYSSSISKATKRNANIIKYHGENYERKIFFQLYSNGGIKNILNHYNKTMRFIFFINSIKNIIPIKIKQFLKNKI